MDDGFFKISSLIFGFINAPPPKEMTVLFFLSIFKVIFSSKFLKIFHLFFEIYHKYSFLIYLQ